MALAFLRPAVSETALPTFAPATTTMTAWDSSASSGSGESSASLKSLGSGPGDSSSGDSSGSFNQGSWASDSSGSASLDGRSSSGAQYASSDAACYNLHTHSFLLHGGSTTGELWLRSTSDDTLRRASDDFLRSTSNLCCTYAKLPICSPGKLPICSGASHHRRGRLKRQVHFKSYSRSLCPWLTMIRLVLIISRVLWSNVAVIFFMNCFLQCDLSDVIEGVSKKKHTVVTQQK